MWGGHTHRPSLFLTQDLCERRRGPVAHTRTCVSPVAGMRQGNSRVFTARKKISEIFLPLFLPGRYRTHRRRKARNIPAAGIEPTSPPGFMTI